MIHSNFYSKYYFISGLDTKNLNKLDKNTSIIYRNYINPTDEKNYCI